MTHMFRCFALALALPLGSLSAQEAPTVARGTGVRVTNAEYLHYLRVVGALESIDSATISVRRDDGDTISVPRHAGTRLDVSTSRGACSRNRGGCIALGLFGGAGLGLVVGWISVQSQGGTGSGSYCSDSPCELVYLLTIPAGAVLGTILGATVGGEHWKSAALPARLSVAPDGASRLAGGLSLHF